MTTAQRTAAAVFLLLTALVVAAAGAWYGIPDSTLVSFLVKRIERAGDLRISYRDDARITRTLSPELSLHNLVIEDTRGRIHIESRSLNLQVSLPLLLTGRLDIPQLWIGESTIAVHREQADSPSRFELTVPALEPTLHDLRIAESVLRLDGEAYRIPQTSITEVSLRESADGIPELSSRVELGGELFDIKAVLPIRDNTQVHLLPFSLFIEGNIIDASIVGQVDLEPTTPVITGALDADLSDLERILEFSELDVPGELLLRARVTGPADRPALEDLSANWAGPEESTVTLKGRVANIAELGGIELDLSGEVPRMEWLTPFLPDSVRGLARTAVAARLTGDASRLNIDSLDFRTRTVDELELSLAGDLEVVQVTETPALANLDIKLAFNAPTTRAARVLLFDTVPELGAIEGTADVQSKGGDPSIEQIDIHTRDAKGIRADMSGRIESFPLDPDRPNRGYDIDVAMKAPQTSLITDQYDLDFPVPGPLDVTYRIQGDTQALQLNRIVLSAGEKRDSLLKATGHLLFRDWELQDPLDSLDIVLDMVSNTEILSAYAAQEPPPLNYRAHARVHTVDGVHRIDDFRLDSLPGEPLQVAEKGSADKVTFLPEISIQGIAIDSSVRTDDIATLNEFFRLDDAIPAAGSLQWRATVTGSNRKLLIDDVVLKAGKEPGFGLVARGRLGYVSADRKWQLEDTDLKVNGHAVNSRDLARALGYAFPDLGPVQATATVSDSHPGLGISTFNILVGEPGNPVLASTGSVNDLFGFRGVNMEAKLHLGEEEFGAFARKHELSDLGTVTGNMQLSDRDGSLGIDSLHIESSRREIFSLKIDGQFGDFGKPGTMAMNARMTARDMKLVGALLGRDWPDHGRVVFQGDITRPAKETLFNATLTSGKEEVVLALTGDFGSTPPKISGKLTARNFFVPDWAEARREKRARERKQEEDKPSAAARAPVFSREPLDVDWMKAVDLDLSVDVESFDREYSEAVSGNMHLVLKSGQLAAYPATLVYPEGEAHMSLRIAANDPLEAQLTFVGENLNPWKGLNIQGDTNGGMYEAEDATMNVNITLNTSGHTEHDLASNLQGDVYVSITEGQIAQSYTHLLFVDIVGWVSDQKKTRYDDVNCAIADYSIDNGVVSTDAFFMDTRRITIAGEGNIDLGKEEIDYVFIPKKKSRIIARAEPVKITGPLNDPKVTAIPAKSLAVTVGKMGTLLFAPYVVAGIVAGEYTSGAMKSGDEDTTACRDYVTGKRQKHKAQEKDPETDETE